MRRSSRTSPVPNLIKHGFLPALFYFFMFCLLTWPLVRSFSTHFFTDDGDGFMNIWNLWWVNTAVSQPSLHPSIWHTDMLHWPFVTTLLDTLEADLCLDTSRVYATGLSNGAMMTSLVGCVMADRFAAVAAESEALAVAADARAPQREARRGARRLLRQGRGRLRQGRVDGGAADHGSRRRLPGDRHCQPGQPGESQHGSRWWRSRSVG